MKKILKGIGVVFLVIMILVILLIFKIIWDHNIQIQDQRLMIKTDEELIGEHLYIERGKKESIDTNCYFTKTTEKSPLVINIHGGAFIAGDADILDTQSDRISNDWNVNVVTVNYKLLGEQYDKQYVITEICDVAKYFIDHSDMYGIDESRIFIMGYSAGGYYAMASSIELVKENIPIKGQILCYAFLGDVMELYSALTDRQKQNIPDALFILAGDEPIGNSSLEYESALKTNGISTNIKIYDDVKHGFIEENNPEYDILHKKNKSSKSPEAEKIARDAEQYIKTWISGLDL